MKIRSRTASSERCIVCFLFRQNGESKYPPKPYCREAAGEREQRIQRGLEPVTVPNEIQCLEAERGKRGVAATDADHKKLAKSRWDKKRALRICKGREEPHHDGTRKLHDERAYRKNHARALGHN